MSIRPVSTVVLLSGVGTNLQRFIDAINLERLPMEIKAVISNNPDAYGLERAKAAKLTTEVVPHGHYGSRDEYCRALLQRIQTYQPELIVLAGFMRVLSKEFVDAYQGRLINLHPSLLPKYPGLNPHDQVLKSGDSEHGASVHFVTEKLDAGPVILQASVPVYSGDTPEVLSERVKEKEHLIYPLAIRWFAEGRLKFVDDHTYLDGKRLPAQGISLTQALARGEL